ncbi:tetratricopeptide repeat protein [Sorangium sp. So ce854]|uniref:tetratricopeptide repeat protein n=1 Tax=Sorangium sp. So ce854 TaxID=3133322 RepID=UPI003F62138F
MSRRELPRIAPADLRDHATEERIARVWDRIEHDLQAREPASPRRAGAAALLAATLAAFAGGLWLGKSIWSEEPAAPALTAVAPTDDVPSLVDVFAAGTQGRTFQLPGGGSIALTPGTTVEVEQRADGGALTLRLVQGEASLDTVSGPRAAALSLVAGEARLAMASGSALRVRHNVDDIDVDVTDGSVKLTSPAGSRELGRGDAEEGVPIRERTAAVTSPEPRRSRAARLPRVSEPAASAEAPPVAAPQPPPPDWRARYNAGNVAEALQSLQQQSGGVDGAIASAKTARELMDLSDLLRTKGGDRSAAMRAFARVVEGFPTDANAPIAAYKLGDMYASMGDQALAARYYEQARSLSPEGNLAEDSFCKRIRAEVVAGNKDEASAMAREYVAKYPDGRCEDVQRLISGEGEEEAAEGEPEAAPPPPSPPAVPDPPPAP